LGIALVGDHARVGALAVLVEGFQLEPFLVRDDAHGPVLAVAGIAGALHQLARPGAGDGAFGLVVGIQAAAGEVVDDLHLLVVLDDVIPAVVFVVGAGLQVDDAALVVGRGG